MFNIAVEKLGLPVVVKASCQGSSVGVKIVRNFADLSGMMDEIYELDHELLLEEYLPGKELMVPVMKTNKGMKFCP